MQVICEETPADLSCWQWADTGTVEEVGILLYNPIAVICNYGNAVSRQSCVRASKSKPEARRGGYKNNESGILLLLPRGTFSGGRSVKGVNLSTPSTEPRGVAAASGCHTGCLCPSGGGHFCSTTEEGRGAGSFSPSLPLSLSLCLD